MVDAFERRAERPETEHLRGLAVNVRPQVDDRRLRRQADERTPECRPFQPRKHPQREHRRCHRPPRRTHADGGVRLSRLHHPDGHGDRRARVPQQCARRGLFLRDNALRRRHLHRQATCIVLPQLRRDSSLVANQCDRGVVFARRDDCGLHRDGGGQVAAHRVQCDRVLRHAAPSPDQASSITDASPVITFSPSWFATVTS